MKILLPFEFSSPQRIVAVVSPLECSSFASAAQRLSEAARSKNRLPSPPNALA